jgi:hypothetical protein
MAHATLPHYARQVGQLRRRLAHAPALPFRELLPQDLAEQVIRQDNVPFRDRLFSPLVTLWVFLSQVLDPDHSCRAAVARLLAWRTVKGLAPCSADTGAYCKARRRLPEAVVARLTRLWHRLHDDLQAGDLVLADRCFSSFWELALARQRGAHLVSRLHQCRRADFRTGRRLGREDHVAQWPKPARPEWMDEATYDALPASLAVREMRVRVCTAPLGLDTKTALESWID